MRQYEPTTVIDAEFIEDDASKDTTPVGPRSAPRPIDRSAQNTIADMSEVAGQLASVVGTVAPAAAARLASAGQALAVLHAHRGEIAARVASIAKVVVDAQKRAGVQEGGILAAMGK